MKLALATTFSLLTGAVAFTTHGVPKTTQSLTQIHETKVSIFLSTSQLKCRKTNHKGININRSTHK